VRSVGENTYHIALNPIPYHVSPAGDAISCINTHGQLIITLGEEVNPTAFAWHEGATRCPLPTVTAWKRGQRPVTIQEVDAAFDIDNADSPLILSLHRNLRQVYVRDAQTTNGF
jgi:hypothetical protein